MRGGRESGQSTVEWVGLVLMLALAFTAALHLNAVGSGVSFARGVSHALLCAFGVDARCPEATVLREEYGDETAELVAEHAPGLVFEEGARWLPVDFRECSEPSCDQQWVEEGSSPYRPGDHPAAAAFTRVVDCRLGASGSEASSGEAIDCSGERSGNLYITYWLYYPESGTYEGVPVLEELGYHPHDWESYQVRIGPGQTSSRASSHHGYNYTRGPVNWASDARSEEINGFLEEIGARPRRGWGPHTGRVHVTAGSQAGNIAEAAEQGTSIEGDDLRLYPLEPLARDPGSLTDFGSITPPWEKAVWSDPEATHTG